jgi:hypothetical protein
VLFSSVSAVSTVLCCCEERGRVRWLSAQVCRANGSKRVEIDRSLHEKKRKRRSRSKTGAAKDHGGTEERRERERVLLLP